MLSSLVISSSSNAVKYSSLFRALGTEPTFLILDHAHRTAFAPFIEHRIYNSGTMHYMNLRDNQIEAHKANYRNTESFRKKLVQLFFGDLKPKKNTPQNLTAESSNDPIQFFEKSEVIDLKFNKQLKNIQLEIRNKGLVHFDHLFIEKTDSCLDFLIKKSSDLVQTKLKSDLIWCSYNFRLSAPFSDQDFWFLENKNYLSIFDNCFYLKTEGFRLSVWSLVPSHQYLNQQFHQDFQNRIKHKIESQFSFTSLSFIDVSEEAVHLMNSQKLAVKDNPCISGFPCFSFFSQENVQDWFNQHVKEFNKKHKIEAMP